MDIDFDKYVMDTEGEFGGQIVQELKAPPFSPEFKKIYETWGRRLLWMDANVVPGAFQMNTTWYVAVPECRPLYRHDEHVHDFDELIGFIGSDPENPNDLGGVIEVGINGELHRLTKSSMIFMPAGMKHLPLSILELKRPIFHFSISMNPTYSGRSSKGYSFNHDEKEREGAK